MVQGDPVIELAEHLKSIFKLHHDAFLVEFLGEEGSGLSEDAVKFLVDNGYITEGDLLGIQILGSKYKLDPFAFILQISSSMNAATSKERIEMADWPLKKWVSHIDDRLDAKMEEAEEEDPALDPQEPVKLVEKPSTAKNTQPAPLISRPPDHVDKHFREAWIEARTRAGEYVRGLGTVVDADARPIAEEAWSGEQITQEADKDRRLDRREEIRVLTAEAVAEGWSSRKLANELAKKSKDYARNWDRIANTELQGAYNDGVILDGYRIYGDDTRVARVPEDGACPDCLRLLLDKNGNPRVFTVDEMESNGTNVGRKRNNWLPTSWPIHPNCRCDTVIVPPGLRILADGRLRPL